MRIASLTLTNWTRFRGAHHLDLGPHVYGVVAEWSDDPDRSNWGGKCLGGKTAVYDPERGPVPIADFVAEERPAAMGLRDGKVVPVPVTAWHRNGTKRIARVTLRDGTSEEYGAEHPVLTSRGFVRASDLVIGDNVAKAGTLEAMAPVGDLSVEDAEMIGLVTGDGTREAGGTFAFTADYAYKRDEFVRVAGLVFAGHVVSDSENMRIGSLTGGHRGPRSDSGSVAMRAWLKKVGLVVGTAAHKRLPSSLMRAGRPAAVAALRTLWLTDGYVGMATKTECSYTSASEGLAHDVRFLLLRLGVQSTLGTKYVDGVPYWTVRLTRASLRPFAAAVEIPGPKGDALRALIAREVPFTKPNIDVIPYEVWSRFDLKTCVRKPDGKLRSITSWKVDRRGMSRDVFLSFGGPTEVADGQVRWEPVVAVDDAGEAETFDITLDSEEHVYVAGRSFALTHNSSLLSAIRFALYGHHPAETEDSWITNGEDQGGVILVLDTGERIERSRIRGKATRLRLDADGRQLHGDEAQDEVVRRVGLGDADFCATVFFEQKTFARFVTARPGQRMEIVRAWLDLDPLYGARDRVAAALRQLLKDEAALGARLAAEGQREAETFASVAGYFPGPPTTGQRTRSEGWRLVLTERATAANLKAEAARECVAGLERRGEVSAQRRRDAADLARHEAIGQELREASGETEELRSSSGNLVQLRKKYDAAAGTANEARRQAGQASKVAAGEFDGACPLLAGFNCPAEGEINGRREESRLEVSKARRLLDDALRVQDDAEREMNVALRAEREESRRAGRLDALRAEQARLAAGAERARRWAGVEVDGDPGAELSALRAEATGHAREAFEVERAVAEFDAGDERRAKLSRELEEKRAEVVARQEALVVLAVARRTIAREALDAIETRANGLLADAGVGLALRVSWEREIAGQLAATCDGCGSPFGTSQRVKECAACGATRGPKVAEELELKVSARSGAADDLASMTFMLAAGAWLRTRRGSGWGVCVLDEPASALDATHRRLLAAHLQSMLSTRHSFVQAFIVSHESGFVEGLPGKIVVKAGPEFSSVEVVT